MKKLLLFLCAIISAVSSRAYIGETIKLDNYKVAILSEESHEVSIGGLGGLKGDIVLPSCFTINGTEYTVVEIMERGFAYNADLTSVTIPGTVTRIGNEAFSSCAHLSSVSIPGSVAEIGYGSFSYCPRLPSVIIPGSVAEIGYGSFAYCGSLSRISVEEGSGHFASVNGVLFNKDMTALVAYPAAKSGGYSIPSSVTSIYPAAFAGCTGLTSAGIPDTVTEIGSYAFCDCEALAVINIPGSVTSLSQAIFQGCRRLSSVDIPDSVTSIGDYAFSGCCFKNITIPESVTSIGELAFDGTNLEEVTIPSSVTAMGTYAFYYCTELRSVNIKGVIGKYAFHSCEKLESVTFGDTATTIGYGSFTNCRALKSLELPPSIKTISDCAFASCSSLDKIILPDSLKRIETETFYSCTGLKKITIPESVTWIECGAFYHCTSLETIIDLRPVPPVVNYGGYYPCFGGVAKTLTIYVPKGSAAAYAEANEWNQFSDFREIEKVMSITPDRTSMTLKVGERTKFSATVTIDGEVVPVRVWWDSSDPRVVFCDIDGNAVAITEGSTTMTGTVYDEYGIRHQAHCAVTVSGETGICDISADPSAPAEIYDLRGIRVSGDTSTLSPGLYILRQGSATRKILVK